MELQEIAESPGMGLAYRKVAEDFLKASLVFGCLGCFGFGLKAVFGGEGFGKRGKALWGVWFGRV